MQRSEARILTTHVASLPRPPALRELLIRQERGEPIDEARLAGEVEAAVRTVVQRQVELGIDVGNDGEQPRVGFSTYVVRRMQGFGGAQDRPVAQDVLDFPDYGVLLAARRAGAARITRTPQAVAEVRYVDLDDAAHTCALFRWVADVEPGRFTERFKDEWAMAGHDSLRGSSPGLRLTRPDPGPVHLPKFGSLPLA